jgi:hypothetical protein
VPTLADYGLDKNDAHKLRKYADMSERDRNAIREHTRERILSKGAVRVQPKRSGKRKPQPKDQQTAELQAKLAHVEEQLAGAETLVDQLASACEYIRDMAGDDVWHDLKKEFPEINHILGNDGDERDQWDAKVAGWIESHEQGNQPDPQELLNALNGVSDQ